MSKIKDLKLKHPEFKIDIIQGLSEYDPSGNNKYLQYMVNASVASVSDYFTSNKFIGDVFKELIELVTNFDKNCEDGVIDNKDIYSYDNLIDVILENEKAKTKMSDRTIKSNETIVLYENKELILIKCLTERSSCLYGKNTQWCTSADHSENQFKDYTKKGILLYLIFKSPPRGLPITYTKVGFNRKNLAETLQVWDNRSNELGIHDYITLNKFLPPEVSELIDHETKVMIPNLCLIKRDGIIKGTHVDNVPSGSNLGEYIKKLNKK